MPVAHRIYEKIKSILSEDFAVEFPEGEEVLWCCSSAKGMNNILIDCYDQLRFCSFFNAIIVESKKRVNCQSQVLKCEIGKTALYNMKRSYQLYHPLYMKNLLKVMKEKFPFP